MLGNKEVWKISINSVPKANRTLKAMIKLRCHIISYWTRHEQSGRVETESDGTRRSTGGEVKGKEANGVGSQQSCTVSEHGLSSITTADAYTSAASSRLN